MAEYGSVGDSPTSGLGAKVQPSRLAETFRRGRRSGERLMLIRPDSVGCRYKRGLTRGEGPLEFDADPSDAGWRRIEDSRRMKDGGLCRLELTTSPSWAAIRLR